MGSIEIALTVLVVVLLWVAAVAVLVGVAALFIGYTSEQVAQAQDVKDALLERMGRWPLCPRCADPHALDVEPELGPDPHWVCAQAGVKVAAVGSLGQAIGGAPSS